MQAIASAIRLLDRNIFDELQIYWKQSPDLQSDLNDIIKINDTNVIDISNTHILHIDNIKIPNGFRIPSNPLVTVKAYDFFTDSQDPIGKMALKDQFSTPIRKIKFRQDLYNKASEINVTNRIGIHCRRTDYPPMKIKLGKAARAKYYHHLDIDFANAIESMYPDDKLLIASDSLDTTNYFMHRFGDRIIHSPKHNYPIWSNRPQKTVEEGIIDMILLSRCKSLIVDSNSTFCTVAGWFGNITKHMWTRPLVGSILARP